MGGAKGIQTASDLCNDLSVRTVVDLKCSLHIHLGNLNLTRPFLIALFRLGYKIQNELFQMFPYYKANPKGIKQKNYNQKLPSLSIKAVGDGATKKDIDTMVDNAYKRLFTWLAGQDAPEDIFKKKVFRHPQPHKWDRSSRYYWLNLMNTIFSERGTVEFRPHTPTMNAQKVLNWLFICNAIVKYAEQNQKEILTSSKKITMNHVLDYYADNFGSNGKFLSNYLKAYVDERKELFFADYEKGDYLSEWEMKEDRDYTFCFEGIGSLV
jgi:hypothetical protein